MFQNKHTRRSFFTRLTGAVASVATAFGLKSACDAKIESADWTLMVNWDEVRVVDVTTRDDQLRAYEYYWVMK